MLQEYIITDIMRIETRDVIFSREFITSYIDWGQSFYAQIFGVRSYMLGLTVL